MSIVGVNPKKKKGSMSIVGVNPKKKNWTEQAIVNQAIACFCIWWENICKIRLRKRLPQEQRYRRL